MTKQEFESRLGGNTVTEEEYKKIEYVYTYYPAIGSVCGKDQIASLYAMLGMTVINDMYPRAAKAEQLEKDIIAAQAHLSRLKIELEKLKKGGNENER